MKKTVRCVWHFIHFLRIAATPERRPTGRQERIDPLSHRGLSLRALRRHIPIPAHGAATFLPAPTFAAGPARAIGQVASDALVDSILIASLSNQPLMVRRLGDNIAYSEGFTYIVLRDIYSGRLRAFRRIARARDLHTPYDALPDSTGMVAAAFAELAVGDDFATPKALMEAKKHALDQWRLLPSARLVFVGFQLNFDSCASPGQLDRDEVPNQFSRVLAFNKNAKNSMVELGMPATTAITIASHSLGCSNALLSRFYWQNHSQLRTFGTGSYITTIEPIGAAIALRKIATLIAGMNIIGGGNADIAGVIAHMTHGVDALVVTDDSPIRSFQIHHSPLNNRLVGARVILLSLARQTHRSRRIAALLEHLAANIAYGLYHPMDISRPGTIASHIHTLSAEDIAADPKRRRKRLSDRAIQLNSYLILAWMKSGETYRHRGSERHLETTIRDIGETLGLPAAAVERAIAAAELPG